METETGTPLPSNNTDEQEHDTILIDERDGGDPNASAGETPARLLPPDPRIRAGSPSRIKRPV